MANWSLVVVVHIFWTTGFSDTIWRDPMNTTHGMSDWETNTFIVSSANASTGVYEDDSSIGPPTYRNNLGCPAQTDDKPCWLFCNGYIYRNISTESYTNVNFTFDVDPHRMADNTKKCQFSYSVDHHLNWTNFYDINGGDTHILKKTISFGQRTWNNEHFALKIEVINHGDEKWVCCYLSNLILYGNKEETLYPSANPSAFPTIAPSSYPSFSPTSPITTDSESAGDDEEEVGTHSTTESPQSTNEKAAGASEKQDRGSSLMYIIMGVLFLMGICIGFAIGTQRSKCKNAKEESPQNITKEPQNVQLSPTSPVSSTAGPMRVSGPLLVVASALPVMSAVNSMSGALMDEETVEPGEGVVGAGSDMEEYDGDHGTAGKDELYGDNPHIGNDEFVICGEEDREVSDNGVGFVTNGGGAQAKR